jgi:hypothetical protein
MLGGGAVADAQVEGHHLDLHGGSGCGIDGGFESGQSVEREPSISTAPVAWASSTARLAVEGEARLAARG